MTIGAVRAKASFKIPRLLHGAQEFLDAPLVGPPVSPRFVPEVDGRRAVGVRNGVGVATGFGVGNRLGDLGERAESLLEPETASIMESDDLGVSCLIPIKKSYLDWRLLYMVCQKLDSKVA